MHSNLAALPVAKTKLRHEQGPHTRLMRTGNPHIFMAAAVLYACSNACIGATPAAYAADVMPSNISGFALGIYRCAGDIGACARLIASRSLTDHSPTEDKKCHLVAFCHHQSGIQSTFSQTVC